MTNEINTKSIGRGIAEIKDDVILSEKPMSRLIFQAKIHQGGIRGNIIRQKRVSNNDEWVSDKKTSIHEYQAGELRNVELPTEAVEKFYLAIESLKAILKEKGIEYGKNKYSVFDSNEVIITDQNKSQYIKKILERGYSEDIWKNLIEQNPSLATQLSYARIQDDRKQIVQELESRLTPQNNSKIQETSGNDSWQKWIYKNNWLFGVNYRQPIEKIRINISGIMPDFLFPTIDGFVDILEIKLPNDEVIIEDKNHYGAWKWTAKSNEAIGQVINYLGEIDKFRSAIEINIKEKYGYKISFLKPRAYILIGDSSLWPDEKKEGLRKMNHALHGIEVLTYKDLLDRGTQAISISSVQEVV